ncbi:RDD family protein [Helicobacter burdigaliensis]|uniref:RDD family protein n=1 Tax=Helicobacter burdigaliensis TaxID=2315334 RepID=UPI000EF74D21|nr:RDD family protein [Helicobacter burdigaliensis]
MRKESIEETLEREEIQVAPLYKRVLAYLVDDFLITLIFLGIYWEEFQAIKGNQEAFISLLSSVTMIWYIILIAYNTIFIALYGANIGHMVVKIRVIEGGLLDKPSWQQAFLRALFKALSKMLLWLPFLLAFENPLRKTLHDRVAKTLVVNLAKSY